MKKKAPLYSPARCALPLLLTLGAAGLAQAKIGPGFDFTFGVSAGNTPSGGLSANFKRGSRFTLTQAGTIGTLCAYIDGNGGASGSQDFRYALYSDAAGKPDKKLAESYTQQLSSGFPAAWNCADIAWTPVTAGSYWIVIQSGNTAGVIRDFSDGTGTNWFGNSDTFADGSSATFGAGNPGTGTMSFQATYYLASDLHHTGRMTIATNPSAGMTADYKRGSSFQLTEPGRLLALTAYLDGKGSTNGAQQVRMVLYKDANGAPGVKVGETHPIGYASGTLANWFSADADEPLLSPGKYWLVLHTGATGGVLRNFSDGGTGNWFANVDAFADGASSPFGSGNAGNGTISAFMSYQPGNFVTGTFGKTTPGATPSQGLKSDYIRASGFVQDGTDQPALTAFYAYLDGKGGASGSQQVRIALYTTFREAIANKVVESEVVTIPAGQAAGWVRFPVKNVRVVAGYYFMAIHTSGTSGVVRDYGDPSPGNWQGTTDLFANGAADQWGAEGGPRATGDTTLTIYASYTKPAP